MEDAGPDLEQRGASAFGGPWDEPRRAASVLRATASAAGLDLRDVTDPDLIAAVVAGHLWCVAAGASSMRSSAGLPNGFAKAGARILARAAGHGPAAAPEGLDLPDVPDCPQSMWREVGTSLQWARRQLGDAADLVWARVLAAAAHDLLAASGTALEATGVILALEAEAASS